MMEDYPENFKDFYQMINLLKFDEKPNFKKLKKMLKMLKLKN
jgi:hypothetical protein